VLDLFESEAVPAKQSLSNIQHLYGSRLEHNKKLVFCLFKTVEKTSSQNQLKSAATKQQKH